MKKTTLTKTILAGLFLALAMLMPQLTGRLSISGEIFLPMHIPIMLCGFICGWRYGLITGFIAPLLNSLIFQIPPLPIAVSMALELAVYGLAAGLCYKLFPKKNIYIYVSLFISMVAGRLMSAAATYVIFALGWGKFSVSLKVLTVTALPGIIIQFILIPLIVIALKRAKLLPEKN